MSDTIIKVEGLGKKYTISHEKREGYTSLRDVISNKVRGILKPKQDDFVTKEDFWALKDVNFEVKQGEAIGIIGRNGAGKSTLLKILSRITEPTHGRIELNGRVASLLEVGTGFHPELTGRENVYLNGAILGMSRLEIKRKFDEIVDFSGVEKFLDTPVKRYSSGMYVRLAFAVAAHLEPEILVVDEVLAVGDAEFQKKCLGKMDDVSKKEGRTVIFVSHNIQAIMLLCKKGIYLKNGELINYSEISEVAKAYSNDKDIQYSKSIKILNEGKKVWLSNFVIKDNNGNDYINLDSLINIEIEIESKQNINNVQIGIGINDINEVRLFTLFSRFYNKSYSVKAGKNLIKCKLEKFNLKPGMYSVEVFIGNDLETFDYYKEGLQFEIFPSENITHLLPDSSQGSIYMNQLWS